MAQLDILEGDVFVSAAGREYPIRGVGWFNWIGMHAEQQLYTETGHTTRDGVLHIGCIQCTPIDPADPGTRSEMIQRLGTDAPMQIVETYLYHSDGYYRLIMEGSLR